jgi:hypothetical protein
VKEKHDMVKTQALISVRKVKRLHWENLGIFSQSQLRIYFVKSQWCELEDIAIEQSFVAFCKERRR